MDPYVNLAKLTVKHFVKNSKKPDLPQNLPEELTGKKAGVFVSLKKQGNLRGCIGTILPVRENIAEEIIQNAVCACSEDPRFPPVREDELDELTYSVDVLLPPEFIDSYELLDVKKYGVIVTHGNKRGLLLPNLEGIDSVEEQVTIAAQKAGITPGQPINLARFEVIRHGENEN